MNLPIRNKMPSGLRNRDGSIVLGVILVALVVFQLGMAAIVISRTGLDRSQREGNRVICINLANAGIQAETGSIWQAFKASQNFTYIDTNASQASNSNPLLTINGTLGTNQRYSVSVIGYSLTDSYNRTLTILSVGWIDTNGNGRLDAGESYRSVISTIQYSLSRSGVFDYTYFVNNYGWMQGFGSSDLVVNGDMRANGNFDFSGGSPTINGSVYAAQNSLLIPAAPGVVNITPSQWTDTYYNSQNNPRARQAYNSALDGAYGSSSYYNWANLIYDNNASVQNGSIYGAVVGDANGTKTYSGTVLDPKPTSALTMPDLSNISTYEAMSESYVDPTTKYNDGTANPNAGQGAYVQTWNSTTGKYDTISTNGVVNGCAVIIGDSTHPVLVHGPVTVTEDIVIKGNIQGQGTLYAGRNVQIVGSIQYQNPPNFGGTNQTTIDNANQKCDMLGLAANQSIIMGDTSQFGSYPLAYMSPPFTNPRYDANGNLIPAYNAYATDSYGVKYYQSLLGDDFIHSVSTGVNQLDCVMYTNMVGGGNIGTSGNGVQLNGSIISKDEAMVLWSLPFHMNYDNRIKEQSLNQKPLIDISLPRTPSVTSLTWQEVLSQ
jgi:hypothetical protein